MQVTINNQPHDLPEGAKLADAVALVRLTPPYAVAINLQFVPNSHYAQTPLHDGDRVEIIRPVTGG
jgi:sulfur carrier protein